jgi:hypothetical protein
MYRIRRAFENARDRGDEYFLVMQKPQGKDAERLTIIQSGKRGQMLMLSSQFGNGGPFTGGGWGFAFVGMFNTAEPWEEHAAYLRALDFKW